VALAILVMGLVGAFLFSAIAFDNGYAVLPFALTGMGLFGGVSIYYFSWVRKRNASLVQAEAAKKGYKLDFMEMGWYGVDLDNQRIVMRDGVTGVLDLSLDEIVNVAYEWKKGKGSTLSFILKNISKPEMTYHFEGGLAKNAFQRLQAAGVISV